MKIKRMTLAQIRADERVYELNLMEKGDNAKYEVVLKDGYKIDGDSGMIYADTVKEICEQLAEAEKVEPPKPKKTTKVTAKSKTGKVDKVAEIITNQILEQLADGVIPWRKPWVGVGTMWSRSTGKPYGVINQMLLFENGEYATFNQIAKEGGKVNKGARSKIIVEYWGTKKPVLDEDGKAVLDEDGKEKFKVHYSKKYVRVFNIEKDTNLKVKHKKSVDYPTKPLEVAEEIIADYTAREKVKFIHEDLLGAWYSPARDTVNIPEIRQFLKVNEYYSTVFHELAHSTGHKTRLDRKGVTGRARFGDHTYGVEELIAEITSASVLHYLGIESDNTLQNTASYIDNWMKAISEDTSMVLSASTYSDKAFKMIVGA